MTLNSFSPHLWFSASCKCSFQWLLMLLQIPISLQSRFISLVAAEAVFLAVTRQLQTPCGWLVEAEIICDVDFNYWLICQSFCWLSMSKLFHKGSVAAGLGSHQSNVRWRQQVIKWPEPEVRLLGENEDLQELSGRAGLGEYLTNFTVPPQSSTEVTPSNACCVLPAVKTAMMFNLLWEKDNKWKIQIFEN